MINQQLLDYIKQSRESGISDGAIRQALLGSGWAVQDIEEAFTAENPKSEILNSKQYQNSKFQFSKKLIKILLITVIVVVAIFGGYFALVKYFPQYAKYIQPYLGPIFDPIIKIDQNLSTMDNADVELAKLLNIENIDSTRNMAVDRFVYLKSQEKAVELKDVELFNDFIIGLPGGKVRKSRGYQDTDTDNAVEYGSLSITYVPIKDIKKLQGKYENLEDYRGIKVPILEIKKITIEGKDFIKIAYSGFCQADDVCGSGFNSWYFIVNDYAFNVGDDTNYPTFKSEDDVVKVLASVKYSKLIDIDATNYQEYADKQYGFSFKYPANLVSEIRDISLSSDFFSTWAYSSETMRREGKWDSLSEDMKIRTLRTEEYMKLHRREIGFSDPTVKESYAGRPMKINVIGISIYENLDKLSPKEWSEKYNDPVIGKDEIFDESLSNVNAIPFYTYKILRWSNGQTTAYRMLFINGYVLYLHSGESLLRSAEFEGILNSFKIIVIQ